MLIFIYPIVIGCFYFSKKIAVIILIVAIVLLTLAQVWAISAGPEATEIEDTNTEELRTAMMTPNESRTEDTKETPNVTVTETNSPERTVTAVPDTAAPETSNPKTEKPEQNTPTKDPDVIIPDNKTIKYTDMVERMTDMKALAYPVAQGEKTSESSAYDKSSRYNEATGRYENWAANDDWGYDSPRSEDGGYIFADLKGPGAIVRIWSADPQSGHIKVFIDGNKTPVIDMPFKDLFGGGTYPFNSKSSELTYDASRGKNCYIPITYDKSCRVIAYDNWGKYYQINYISFAKGTQVESFKLPLNTEQKNALSKVNTVFSGNLTSPVDSTKNDKTIKKTVTINAGKEISILNSTGPGAVTNIKIKLNNATGIGEDWQALSELAISTYWDGEKKPAVWTTLGGFFGTTSSKDGQYKSLPLGVDSGGEMYANWYMPYKNGAHIAIKNDGTKNWNISYEVTTTQLEAREASKLMRFHAKWNRMKDPSKNNNDRWPDSQFLYTEGTGRFVGTSLHVYKEIGTGDPAYNPDWWWGEGDEKFFVDGEAFPSWFGTGAEDYFGYAWGTWKTFSRPYHSQPFTNGGMFGIGNRVNNRFHIIDSVPFTKSFNANLEKYHRDRYANLVVTNYWYLMPGGTDSYGPVSLKARTEYYESPYPKSATYYEGEELKIKESTGMMKAETQEMSPFPKDKWSNNSHMIFKAESAGSYVTMYINVAQEGDYNIAGMFTKANDYGIAQHYLDDKKLGVEIDLYDTDVVRTGEIFVDRVHLKPGLHEFKVVMTGKNTASRGYFYGIDYLKITP